MKKIIILFASLLLFQNFANAACVGQKCTMESIFNSWKGENINELISVWGYPDTNKTIAGHNLYFWKQGTYRVRIGNKTKTMENCTRIIEVNESEKIIAGRYKGGKCPGTQLTAKKWMKPDVDVSIDE